MNLADLANIATIVTAILFTITILVDRWPQMTSWGKPYLPKISLAFLVLAVISAGVSFIAPRHISPPITVTMDQKTKIISGEMVPFDYEEITVTKDKAVGLGLARLKAMETATNNRYMAIIRVADSEIAYLYTGDLPTSTTKNRLYPGDGITLDSFTAMKQFKAIGIGGIATLAVSYLQAPAK